VSQFQTVSIIGLGYIGLPTATAFAARGVKVVGVDVNRNTVDTINRGEIHIVEPGLDKAVRQAVESGCLRATMVPEPADTFIIAVPTPFKGTNNEPDLSYIEAASRAVAPVLKPGNLVVLESTSPVGATEQMASWLEQARPDLTFPHQAGQASSIRIAHCPERVLPGRAMEELVSNDRIIGGITPRCAQTAKALYEVFVQGECITTDARTAELSKLAENAFRDVNIAYANELSLVCDKLGVDVWQLIQLANRHPRVNILQPGAGVGGHCIAVDPWFIVAGAPQAARLIHTARTVNDGKPHWVLAKIDKAVERFKALHAGAMPVIAALGLSFKPDIDDLRESPALEIAETLHRKYGQHVLAVEPHVSSLPPPLAGCRHATLSEAQAQADMLIVLVKHSAFQVLTSQSLREGQQIVDVVGLMAKNAVVPRLPQPLPQTIGR